MDYSKMRLIARDSVFYGLLRTAMMEYCRANVLGTYSKYFASILGYTSLNAHIQFSACVGDEAYRKLSVDELQIIFRELGSYGTAAINRFLDTTGLYVSSVESSDADLSSFPILHLIKSGELAKSVNEALSDGNLSKDEQKEILINLDDMVNFLSSLRASLRGDE